MLDQRGEGCQNAQKNIIKALVTNFAQTCSLIPIYNGKQPFFVVMIHLSEQVRLVEL